MNILSWVQNLTGHQSRDGATKVWDPIDYLRLLAVILDAVILKGIFFVCCVIGRCNSLVTAA